MDASIPAWWMWLSHQSFRTCNAADLQRWLIRGGRRAKHTPKNKCLAELGGKAFDKEFGQTKTKLYSV
jgi:hypothetical protein